VTLESWELPFRELNYIYKIGDFMSQHDWNYWYALGLEHGLSPEQAEKFADKKVGIK